MSTKQSRQSHNRFSGKNIRSHNNFTRKRKFNRDFIPLIAHEYYTNLFPQLKGKSGWQNVRCIFHDDSDPSLRISLTHGGFKCFACRAAGDLVKFHMMMQQKTFLETINDLNAWETYYD